MYLFPITIINVVNYTFKVVVDVNFYPSIYVCILLENKSLIIIIITITFISLHFIFFPINESIR